MERTGKKERKRRRRRRRRKRRRKIPGEDVGKIEDQKSGKKVARARQNNHRPEIIIQHFCAGLFEQKAVACPYVFHAVSPRTASDQMHDQK